MTHTNTTKNNGLHITRNRTWDFWSVRDACIKNDLYTCGTIQEYNNMLDHVSALEPTTAAMFHIAKDIQEHSEDQTITNVMFILERDAVITTFEIDGKRHDLIRTGAARPRTQTNERNAQKMKKSKTVNVTTWAGYITICNVRRIEQDHLFWYIWSGNKLEPEIISKGAGKLTVEEIEIWTN